MTIMTARANLTNLDGLIIELESALEKVNEMTDRAGERATYEEGNPWPVSGCPWGTQLVDGALAGATLNSALSILRAGRDAMQAPDKA
jgi:hypothetical protein